MSHEDGEQAGPQQISHGFRDMEARFRKGRRPLGHGLLRCSGADHQQGQYPEDFEGKEVSDGQGTLLFLHQGDVYKRQVIECYSESGHSEKS